MAAGLFAPQPAAAERLFLNGVDANYWLYCSTTAYDSPAWAERVWKKTVPVQTWRDGARAIEPLPFLHERGVNAFRVRVWVGEDGPHGLAYALATARSTGPSWPASTPSRTPPTCAARSSATGIIRCSD